MDGLIFGGFAAVAVLSLAARTMKLLRDDERRANSAWREARRQLDGMPFAASDVGPLQLRSIRMAMGSATADLSEQVTPLVIDRSLQVVGTSAPLPSMHGARLAGSASTITSTPRFLQDAFFDDEIRGWLAATKAHVTLEDGVLHLRREGRLLVASEIVALGRLLRALTTRWLGIVRTPMQVAEDLGFDATGDLAFTGTTQLGVSFRNGRGWTLELVCTDATCEVVLRSGGAELRFDALRTPTREISEALETKEHELGSAAAYR